MEPGDGLLEALRIAARAHVSPTVTAADELRAVRCAANALAAREAQLLLDMAEVGVPEAEGASGVSTWARRELNQDAGTTRAQVRRAQALRDLPCVGEAARAGRLSPRHLDSFVYAIRFVGLQTTRVIEQPLLEFALAVPPQEFHAKVREVRATWHPDDLDRAWVRGMDKCDVALARTLDGWHVSGFLPIEVGAKLKAVLDNLAVPRAEGDTRAPSTRRVEGLDRLLDSVLENGLPSDNGIRPHLHVVARDDKPFDLEGFGPIGAALAGLIGCTSEATPYLVNPVGDLTGVGRSRRLATASQAKAIRLRQKGRCARAGCHHPIAHLHHIRYWSDGGATELENLEGLCRKCHILTHTRRPATGQVSRPVPRPQARTG